MLLILAIVQNQDAAGLLDSLIAGDYRATRIQTVGGFLQEGNVTILAVIEDGRLADALGIIQANCHTRQHHVNVIPALSEVSITTPYPIEVEVGGATIFVFDVVRLERI